MFMLEWVKTKTSKRESELALGVLILIITNVFLAIAIVAIQTKEEICQNTPTKVVLKQEITELWLASLRIAQENILVGSVAVVSEKWVLTSASCVEESKKWPKSKKILLDSYEESHNITKIVKHKNADLALLKVDVPFYPEQLITYGLKKPMNIKETTLVAYSKKKMSKMIDYKVSKINVVMNATKTCGKLSKYQYQHGEAFFCGICHDNSSALVELCPGGFLLKEKHLIGVAISKSIIAQSCGFVNVTSFVSWISKNISK